MQIGPLYNSFLTAHGIPSVPKRWLDSGESVGFQSARRQRLALNFGRSLPAGLFATCWCFNWRETQRSEVC